MCGNYNYAINELMLTEHLFVGIHIKNELLAVQMYLSGKEKKMLFDMDVLDIMLLTFRNTHNIHCYELVLDLQIFIRAKYYSNLAEERELRKAQRSA